MDNYIFIVEGAHDVALVGSILKLLKFKNVRNINNLMEIEQYILYCSIFLYKF